MKRTLITGASSGIGRALAFEFAARGHNLFITASDEAKLESVRAELLGAHSVEVDCIAEDLRDPDAARRIAEASKPYEIEILVNDAGFGEHGKFWETELDTQMDVVKVNIEALTRLTHQFLRPMIERNEGRILNLGSIAGFQPGPLFAVYSATKAYVVSFSEALSDELKDTNVTVTCLCPGPVDTEFFRKADMLNTVVYQKMHGLMDTPETVAKAGYDALMSGDPLIVPGMINKIITFSRRIMTKQMQAKAQRAFYEYSEE
jgi:uncharacterized protein